MVLQQLDSIRGAVADLGPELTASVADVIEEKGVQAGVVTKDVLGTFFKDALEQTGLLSAIDKLTKGGGLPEQPEAIAARRRETKVYHWGWATPATARGL